MRSKTLNGQQLIQPVKKRTSQGDGLRKRGSFKRSKRYRGQGK
jgi:hypothetical protein